MSEEYTSLLDYIQKEIKHMKPMISDNTDVMLVLAKGLEKTVGIVNKMQDRISSLEKEVKEHNTYLDEVYDELSQLIN